MAAWGQFVHEYAMFFILRRRIGSKVWLGVCDNCILVSCKEREEGKTYPAMAVANNTAAPMVQKPRRLSLRS